MFYTASKVFAPNFHVPTNGQPEHAFAVESDAATVTHKIQRSTTIAVMILAARGTLSCEIPLAYFRRIMEEAVQNEQNLGVSRLHGEGLSVNS